MVVCPVDPEAPPSAITLQFDPVHALSYADLATPDEDGDGVLTEADGLLGNTVTFGVVSTPSWNLEISP